MKIIVPKERGLDIHISRHSKSGWLQLIIYHATDGTRYEWGVNRIGADWVNGDNKNLLIELDNEQDQRYNVFLIPETSDEEILIKDILNSTHLMSRDKETETVWFAPWKDYVNNTQLYFFRNWGELHITDKGSGEVKRQPCSKRFLT